jgi:dihydrofolate synthase/folylpolyglutamate synthase
MADELDYGQALAYLYSLTDYEKEGFAAYAPEFYNLERMLRLLGLLGMPQSRYRAVHIAGTKGKGSTAAMIESVLRAAGYQTGLYTSPHLHTFRERIQVRGVLIPETDVIRLVRDMQPLASQVAEITTFEVMTGMAFAWFAEQAVEWAVLEVGLGGRLDATNVITPQVSVITSVSRDHMAVLGETLAEIAGEKAGIIKPGVPVVSAPQAGEALEVIEAVCAREGAPLTVLGHDWTWEAVPSSGGGQAFSLYHGGHVMPGLAIPLLGAFQVENAATAVAALSVLQEQGLVVPQDAIREGLWAVDWPGRMEVLARGPLVIADSAHNGDSARKLIAALKSSFEYQRLFVILGASADHLTPGLLGAVRDAADRGIATQSQHPRAAPPGLIVERSAGLGFSLTPSQSVSEALGMALGEAGPDDLICCTGSVFVAAEAREEMFARQGRATYPPDPS